MNVHECSGSTLAYIGDAVWSLFVRQYLVEKGFTKAKDLQEKSVAFVSAKAQASFYHMLKEEAWFTEEEEAVFKRGRNFKSESVPKNTSVSTYRISTGFEALIGYWHLTKNETRLMQTWDKIKTKMEE